MGLFSFLTRPGTLGGAPLSTATWAAMETPNQTSALSKVVYSEYFAGEDSDEVTRESAMQIPALKKARNILITTLASTPLREFEAGAEVDQPWLYSTTGPISPWHRMAYILDDIFFYDWSCLKVQRDSTGQIVDGVRVPIARWSFDGIGLVVDNQPASDKEYILIPGNGSGGVLACGAQAIKGYRALDRAWIGRAQSPIPALVIEQTGDDELEQEDVDKVVADWIKARTSPNGAVGFIPKGLSLTALGTASADMYESARNAAVLDIARLTDVPASMLDGSMSTADLTYSTAEGHRNEFLDYALPNLLEPIQARLSMDDVSPKGRVIRFDKSALVTTEQTALTNPLGD